MKATLRLAATLTAGLLAACTGGNDPAPAPTVPPVTLGSGRTFLIKPDATATDAMKTAMIQALPGDVIRFDCGFFDLTATLQLINTEAVTIKGCGIDQTVLSFRGNNAPEGILAVNVAGLVIEDLTVLDTGGNGVELRAVNHGTVRRVRALWSPGGGREATGDDRITAANAFVKADGETKPRRLNIPCTDPPTRNPKAPDSSGGDTTSPDYKVSDKAGRYGIYPVASRNILVDESESVGASDAGIYLGQSDNSIIRRSRAAYNVFGMEIENVTGGQYDTNIAECNTGGFLIYDTDGLAKYGDRSRVFNNISRMNNTYNFTESGFVSNVPQGSGLITMAYDRVDIFDNEFYDNDFLGIAFVSYEVFPEGDRPGEKRIDLYDEGVHIFRNKFRNNGNALAPPNSNDAESQKFARFFPVMVGLKNQAACSKPENSSQCAAFAGETYRGAHIVWDGLEDVYAPDCPYPVDAAGQPVPKDERGKPLLTNEHPNPSCHYNAYKFDTAKDGAPRIVPDWFPGCIDDDNEFSTDSLAFTNVHGTKGLEAVLAANPDDPEATLDGVTATDYENFAADLDRAPMNCAQRFGKTMALLPNVVIPPFVPSGALDPAPSDATVAQLCGAAVEPGQANFAAAPVNCPRLDQYHLFVDAADPTSAPNGGGVPFSMNTKLFSDYAVKYRVAYLPPGTKANWDTTRANSTLVFPTGTIIAKTFSFRDEAAGTETPLETRLLIKRVSSKGIVRWDGLPYVWTTEDGKRVAKLTVIGTTASARWDLHDVDSGAHYAGSTDKYLVPNINQCQTCHSTTDKEAGASPIGLKVRNLNGPFRSESAAATDQGAFAGLAGKNQLEFWCGRGLIAGCPGLDVDATTQVAKAVERIPVYNKPGDGHATDTAKDVEARARAWLEVNCQHCHNDRGYAGTTGLFLDSRRAVDQTYGICKHPIATGTGGSDNRSVDIHPGNPDDSILEFRISPKATTNDARMPPIARSVVDAAGHALVRQWIQDVVVADESKYPNSTSCQ
jgi:parallel beta-helix repeat protein